MITKIVTWFINITPQDEDRFTTESILNTRSEEFNSFISSIKKMLGAAEFVEINHIAVINQAVNQYILSF